MNEKNEGAVYLSGRTSTYQPKVVSLHVLRVCETFPIGRPAEN